MCIESPKHAEGQRTRFGWERSRHEEGLTRMIRGGVIIGVVRVIRGGGGGGGRGFVRVREMEEEGFDVRQKPIFKHII